MPRHATNFYSPTPLRVRVPLRRRYRWARDPDFQVAVVCAIGAVVLIVLGVLGKLPGGSAS